MLRQSVSAREGVERRVIGEFLRREAEVELPGEKEEGDPVKVFVHPVRFEQEPVPGLLLDGVTVSSSGEKIEVGLLPHGQSEE